MLKWRDGRRNGDNGDEAMMTHLKRMRMEWRWDGFGRRERREGQRGGEQRASVGVRIMKGILVIVIWLLVGIGVAEHAQPQRTFVCAVCYAHPKQQRRELFVMARGSAV